MNAITNVKGLTVSYDAYIRHGWSLVPISPGTKGSNHKGWNKRENCLKIGTQLPQDFGVGLAHAYSGTMALDIDDYETTKELLGQHNIYLDLLISAPDAVMINSGNPGHYKLIYAMPFGTTLPSKKIRAGDKTAYELRCATSEGLTVQDVLPPSRHPRGTTYQWAGNGNWQRLPMIPQEVLTLWHTILEKDSTKSIKIEGTSTTSWDEVKSALSAISPDCDRQTWIDVGMALHSTGHEDSFHTWNEWSAQSTTKYSERDMPVQWRSFKDKENGITIATLFHHAQAAGWQRPRVDVAHLFRNITLEARPQSIIDGLLTKPPECDINLFPKVLADRANRVADEIGADPLLPAFAGLAAVSAAADKRIRLHLMANWYAKPILWVMNFGVPASKKSWAPKPMMSILAQLEAEDAPRYKDELLRFEAADSAYSTAKKAYLQAASDPALMLSGTLDISSLPSVPEQPKRPTNLRLTVRDITSQKLMRMCGDRPRGILAYMDEMKSWIEKITSRDSGESRSTWTEAYEGEATSLDRVGDGDKGLELKVENLAVSIYGNIQPEVYRAKFHALADDGFVQRFIYAILRPELSDRLNDPSAADPAGQEKWEQVVRLVYSIPPDTVYTLSPDAYTVFRDYQNWELTLKMDERIAMASTIYQEAIGKLSGQLARLILIFHLIEAPLAPQVSVETTQRAIDLIKSYILPSMRYIYGEVGGIDNGSLEHWVLNHIMLLAGEQDTVTLSELKRSARRQVSGMTPQRAEVMLIDAMRLLEGNGYLATIEQNNKSIRWAINPKVASLDPDYREAALKAKQRCYERIHEMSNGAAKQARVMSDRLAERMG